MRNLLDTHTFIWFVNWDSDLSAKARKNIINGKNYLNIASVWEIAIKVSLNKLELYTSFRDIESQIVRNNFKILPITISDTFVLSSLPFHHKDPFDRIIIAQSINNQLVLISKDKCFCDYEVQLPW